VIPAVVSPLEYDAAILKINAAVFPNADRVTSFGLPADTAAMDARVKGLADLSPSEQSDLQANLERISGQPVHLESARDMVPTARNDFTAPWEGGGQIRHNTGGGLAAACTDGFPVLISGTYGRVLGARHCDESGTGSNWYWSNWTQTATFTNGGSDVDLGATALDTMLIDPVGGTEGTVFGGSINQAAGTARYKLNVNGAARAHIGDYVCTSGATSGEHYSNGCLIRVDSTDAVACSATTSGICHRFVGYNIVLNGIAVAGGDSGGPVYADLGNDRVGARGIIWAGSQEVPCVNVRFSDTTCYHYVLVSDIVDDLDAWNVTIETN